MRIVLVPFVCAVFAAMASVAQAESAIMKQSEPMGLTEQQMNIITAGASGGTVISHAVGTHSSHSTSTITTSGGITKGHGIADFCCGTKAFGHVVFSPFITKFLANIFHSITDGHGHHGHWIADGHHGHWIADGHHFYNIIH